MPLLRLLLLLLMPLLRLLPLLPLLLPSTGTRLSSGQLLHS
jgi:hypothetical protein